jgi:hypothetical protein
MHVVRFLSPSTSVPGDLLQDGQRAAVVFQLPDPGALIVSAIEPQDYQTPCTASCKELRGLITPGVPGLHEHPG